MLFKSRDVRMLFATRCLRMFAYGFLSVVLMLYLAAVGLSKQRIGVLFSLTLAGDTLISLWITTHADRSGRRRMLIAGAVLMVFAGAVFAGVAQFWLLLVAATIGVISPSGNEVGPFLAIEQAAMSELLPDDWRTGVFAWYNLAGSLSTALGALAGGLVCQMSTKMGLQGAGVYRPVVIGYGLLGLGLAALFFRVSAAVEAPAAAPKKRILGLHKSGRVVARLSALFALDAFGGGFVLQSMIAYWFHLKFGVQPRTLGAIFFGANILAGFSALSAAWLAKRIGLINTMVFTHLPSNVLLILVPLMPNLALAIAVLLMRFSISQMDVPTRQAYTVAVVDRDERSAAAGITGIARSIGAMLSPLLAGPLMTTAALGALCFYISGGCKIVYDLLLYRSFVKTKPPEEMA